MDVYEASRIIEGYLREEYGKLLAHGSIERYRAALGQVWRAPVLCRAGEEEFQVGYVAVDDSGEIVEPVLPEELVAAIRAAAQSQAGEPVADELKAWEEELASELAEEEFAQPEQAVGPLEVEGQEDAEALWDRVEELLGKGDEASLLEARNLLPRILVFPEHRAVALSELAWVEMQLGHRDLALDYLEAAAREFADQADVESLRLLCEKVEELVGTEAFQGSVFHKLLLETDARVRPVAGLAQVPVLSGLEPELHEAVEGASDLVVVEPGQDLLREGEPSLNVFFVREGRLAVLVAAPSGELRPITMLLPGDLVGESSVLVEGEPTCNATVRAEERSVLWRVAAREMLALFARFPGLRDRVAAARELRNIHSFMSLHPTLGGLEDAYRFAVIGCILGVETFGPGTVVVPAGEPPQAGYLVLRGAVAQKVGGRTIRIFGPDDFLGFRDALHGIASECEYVALESTTLVMFDAERLRQVALDAPPHVATVLERLE